MADVQTSFVWSERTKLLIEGIVGRSDIPNTLLELYFDTAVGVADKYLNNDFTDDCGDDLPLPAAIKRGVGELVKLYVQDNERDLSVKSVSNLNVSVTYGTSAAQDEQETLVKHFGLYRRNPGY